MPAITLNIDSVRDINSSFKGSVTLAFVTFKKFNVHYTRLE